MLCSQIIPLRYVISSLKLWQSEGKKVWLLVKRIDYFPHLSQKAVCKSRHSTPFSLVAWLLYILHIIEVETFCTVMALSITVFLKVKVCHPCVLRDAVLSWTGCLCICLCNEISAKSLIFKLHFKDVFTWTKESPHFLRDNISKVKIKKVNPHTWYSQLRPRFTI